MKTYPDYSKYPPEMLKWTAEEEKAFAEIQTAGDLPRIKAIQIWKRFNKNTKKAVRYAAEQRAFRERQRSRGAKRKPQDAPSELPERGL